MDLSELSGILKGRLQLSKPKLECLCELMLSLVLLRTVNLHQLAAGMSGDALLNSKYRRIQRLIAGWPVSMDWLGPWLLGWFFESDSRLRLTLDRTTWYFGKTAIDFMVVGVVYKKMAIPLMFSLSNNKGSSSTFERIYLLERVLKYIPAARIDCLLGDREFIGERWFGWLQDNSISFKIRLKGNFITASSRGKELPVSWLFDHLKPGQRESISDMRPLFNGFVYLTGARSPDGELMIIASDTNETCAIEAYLQRWEIESLFENLKSRGFDLEATHITDPDRLSALFQILMLASCWCLKCGDWAVEEIEPIKVKKHGRPAQSVFRHGMNQIRQAISRGFSHNREKLISLLWRLLPSPPLLLRL